MEKIKNLILGAGIAGISSSYHLGHKNCLILEKNTYPYGLLFSTLSNGYTWDQGPHVSFTKHEYVRNLLADNINNEFYEHAVTPKCYYQGLWIDHPVQTNLYQLPDNIKTSCINSFLKAREGDSETSNSYSNYRVWLESAMGEEITDTFVAPYTRKYWTTENLTIDWIGPRIYKPSIDDVMSGSVGKLDKSSHYITKIRYPKSGGYQSFVNKLGTKANIQFSHEVEAVDLDNKIVCCSNGKKFNYKNLISSLPLPVFVKKAGLYNKGINEAADQLACSELLLINVEVPEKITFKEHWLYVYDEKMYSTRITLMNNLSDQNSPTGKSGVQVEVYFSKYRNFKGDILEIGNKVVKELLKIGIISNKKVMMESKWSYQWVPFANIVFDHKRRDALNSIFSSLEPYGLIRTDNDLEALTDWDKHHKRELGELTMIGRFGEWKYYWSDDCILTGRSIS